MFHPPGIFPWESASEPPTCNGNGQGEALVQLGHLQKSLDLAEALGFLQSQKKAQTLALLQAPAPWLEEAMWDVGWVGWREDGKYDMAMI